MTPRRRILVPLTAFIGVLLIGLSLWIAVSSIDECLSGDVQAYWGMTKLGASILLLVSGFVFFGHGVKRTLYKQMVDDARGLIAELPEEEEGYGLVRSLIWFGMAALVSVSAFLPVAWLAHVWGLPFTIVAWVVFAFVLIKLLWRDWKALAALLIMNVVPVSLIFVEAYAAAAGLGAAEVALFCYAFALQRSQAGGRRGTKVFTSTSVQEVLKDVKEIARDIRAKAYKQDFIAYAQALTIFLVVGFFVAMPILIRVVPPSLVEDGGVNLLNKIEEAREFVPHIAFAVYLLMSSMGVFNLLLNPLATRLIERNSPLVFLTFPILVILLLCMVLPLGMLLISFAYMVLATGSMLGTIFVLLLGFFVFPQWVVAFLSYIAAFLLCYYPLIGMKRRE